MSAQDNSSSQTVTQAGTLSKVCPPHCATSKLPKIVIFSLLLSLNSGIIKELLLIVLLLLF